jgi:hypothetical protein
VADFQRGMGGDLSPEPQTNFLRKQPSKFKKETGFILKANNQIPRAQKNGKTTLPIAK